MSLRIPILTCLALACAGGAAADAGSVQETLTPNTPGADSHLQVSAHGPFSPPSGRPTSVRLVTQPGFRSSAGSVKVLCTAQQESQDACPAASRVGAGTATATGTLGTVSEQDTISFTIYLGVPQRRGDIASLQLSGSDSLFHQSAHATGRLLSTRTHGLELLFDQLPSPQVPAGTQVTLDRLDLHAGAVRTVIVRRHRRRVRERLSLITNPPTCHGKWSSVLTVMFSDGSSQSRTFLAACRAP